ncbi:MAG: hypothetical protein MR051_05640 [Lentisphaeria bacterium]|nr:hypothetical protein [Lentisphaeria bacterium]
MKEVVAMKFHFGYQNHRRFLDCLLARREQVAELYFAWENFTTGRGLASGGAEQRQLETDLRRFANAGIDLCLLLNGNCYGRRTLARSFFQRLGDTVDRLRTEYGLAAATTASPLIARFLRANFPQLELRASVNMEIGTPEAVEYVAELFDSFYLKREYNYDPERMARMRDLCHARGKKLFLLANSGCLNFCSARTFHDNLVAHQHETAEMDNAFEFHGVCTMFLKAGDHRDHLLFHSNFIRPEDIPRYEPFCDGMKLATRTNFNPAAVAAAYLAGHWHGNLLDLTEPAHSELFHPRILANAAIPADYAATRWRLTDPETARRYCKDIQQAAMVTPPETMEP